MESQVSDKFSCQAHVYFKFSCRHKKAIRYSVNTAQIESWFFQVSGRRIGFFLSTSLNPRCKITLDSLRKGVFERRSSTGSKTFCRLICLDATTFVLPCFFTLIQTICPKILAKTFPKNEKNSLPIDERRSKTSLLKLAIGNWEREVNFRLNYPEFLRNHGFSELGFYCTLGCSVWFLYLYGPVTPNTFLRKVSLLCSLMISAFTREQPEIWSVFSCERPLIWPYVSLHAH